MTETRIIRKLEAPASPSLRPADHASVAAIERALLEARRAGDEQPPFAIIADALAEFGVVIPLRSRPSALLVERGRDEWLRRLRSGGRSESALRAYRGAIDDLLSWAERSDRGGELFEERAIVDHLDDYRQRVSPAAATYHRRFLILRRFMRWLSRREGVPDPFLDLEAPRKPRQESEWLTPAEFRRMLEAAGKPLRRHTGIVERDRLVLLALVTTGLRRSELIDLDWRDLNLDRPPAVTARTARQGRQAATATPRAADRRRATATATSASAGGRRPRVPWTGRRTTTTQGPRRDHQTGG